MESSPISSINSLDVTNLSFSYQGWAGEDPPSLFENLTFSIPEGGKALLLAPFDSGKSTLGRILVGGIPKYFPGTLEGAIKVMGHDLADIEIWDLLDVVTLVSQNPQEQFVASTVEEEVAFALESLGLPQKEMRRRVEDALTSWGINELRQASNSELSGGERKRVLLAAAEALDAPFWILDEAFDDLDLRWREHLARFIQTTDKTILLFSSRYLARFDRLFDHVFLLEHKQVCRVDTEQAAGEFAILSGDVKPNPLAGRSFEHLHRHTLSVSDLVVERQRFSASQAQRFHLQVPTFRLHSGEIVSLVGPNGSGKSSLSRVLCGLDEPLEGARMIDDEVLDGSMLNRSVGYLFQNPDLQIFLPTVKEELSYSLRRVKGLSDEEISKRVAECADLFELKLSHTPSTMSYPKRKALQAAVYYLLDRPFYILDELDTALTYHSALAIIGHLQRNGAGILIITHDRQFITRVGGRVYQIEEGRVSER
jgi:energy-coupling factor transport system ATP-binding protein